MLTLTLPVGFGSCGSPPLGEVGDFPQLAARTAITTSDVDHKCSCFFFMTISDSWGKSPGGPDIGLVQLTTFARAPVVKKPDTTYETMRARRDVRDGCTKRYARGREAKRS